MKYAANVQNPVNGRCFLSIRNNDKHGLMFYFSFQGIETAARF